MKKILLLLFVATSLISAVYMSVNDKPTPVDNSKVHWYTMEEALAANEKNPKMIFIDMYTDWCGWCKVMDKKTFTDSEVIEQLNANYYQVKFNAEQKDAVEFNGQVYNYIPAGRRGIHELAYELLDRKASYPSFVILDENLQRTKILKGYLTVDRFLPQI